MRPLFFVWQGIFALCLILVGLGCVGLEYAPLVRHALIKMLSGALPLIWVGAVIAACGLSLFIAVLLASKKRSYVIRMGAEVEAPLIQTLVEHYWKLIFPEHEGAVQIEISRAQELRISVEFPVLAPEEQRRILRETEEVLSQLLRSQLGYHKPFVIFVTTA